MDAHEPHFVALREIAAQLRAGSISSVELTEHMLARIAELDPQLHAFRLVTARSALAEARRADAELGEGFVRGPLHGVPVAIDDLLDVAGAPTFGGLPELRSRPADHDAAAVARATGAGAVVLGKVHSAAGALREHRPDCDVTVSPWRAGHWPGTTAGGVALAAGLCFGVVAGDAGGSLRFAAAANGLTGLKPSRGRVSRHGAFPLAESLDHVGPMCRSAADLAVLLGAIAGHDERDPVTAAAAVPDYTAALSADLDGVRIGVDPAWGAEGVDPVVVDVVRAAVETFVGAGAEVAHVAMPAVPGVGDAWRSIAAVEAALTLVPDQSQRDADLGPLSRLVDLAEHTSGMDVVRAQRAAEHFVRGLEHVFESADVVVMPLQPRAAVSVADHARLRTSSRAGLDFMHFASPFNLSGNPALTLPGGFTDGVPVAFQLVARPLAESLLIRAAHAFQQVTDWHTRHPAV